MFKLLGTPNEKIWPGLSELPSAKKISISHQPYNNLRQKFPFITENTFDLLNRMLTYDPTKRIGAAQALDHPYFRESPRAKEPDMMPTWPSKAAGRAIV
jgi:cell division cycle 2-like protein